MEMDGFAADKTQKLDWLGVWGSVCWKVEKSKKSQKSALVKSRFQEWVFYRRSIKSYGPSFASVVQAHNTGLVFILMNILSLFIEWLWW